MEQKKLNYIDSQEIKEFYRTLKINIWYRRRDLNSHNLTVTAPSRQRVYQFHHVGLKKKIIQG